jgi:hypothetical protein
MSAPAEKDAVKADDRCDDCGQFGTLEIGGRRLCGDCVTLAGCGCGGLGGNADED